MFNRNVNDDIYQELSKIPDAVGIDSIERHCCQPDHNDPPFPGGESIIDNSRTYQDTLLRSGTKGLKEDEKRCRDQWHGIVFEPENFDTTVQNILKKRVIAVLCKTHQCLLLS